ncbi:serine/threonine protein kinase [Hypoxylon sp. FL1284]|nr:serine/threonine protein kinase [Hypoxylon sp. FL1284]
MAPATSPPKNLLSANHLISLGATGWVFRVNERIALKYAREPGSIAFENEIFDLFEKHAACPHVVQSFLRLPDANLMALMSGGSLDARLRSHQVREHPFGKVLEVTRTEPVELVKQWLVELCRGVVWLESLGYTHGDLRPNNPLLDGDGHLKLAGFDCVQKIGEPFDGNEAPWARVLGDDAEELGARRGSYGIAGPRTEQFAIGSILYCMVYGLAPYGNMDDQGPIIVDLLQEMKFPTLNESCLDAIIDRCWKGHYQQLGDLLKQVESLCNIRSEARNISVEELDQHRKECQVLVEDGLLS